MSLARILTIVKKDMAWALGNIKLLGIMILPVFVVVFFSRFDSASTFGFSMIFVNAFVGIFSTSYLVIEEKNKGTLLALLTSPLTGAELLFGKFLFNLILCSFFSTLVIILNDRLDLFFEPLALLNILLFAGTTCFVGFLTGVFFKNEQEMSVLAPFLMFLFCFGDAAEKVSDKNNVHAFFPDYHLAQSVKDMPLETSALLGHLGFSLAMFLVAFFAATSYTQFYFSNNRERRFSGRLLGFTGLFLSLLVASGVSANISYKRSKSDVKGEGFEFSTPKIKAKFRFDPSSFRHKTLLQSRTKSMELLTSVAEADFNLIFAIRDLESDEATIDKREEKVLRDTRRNIIGTGSVNLNGERFKEFIYTRGKSFILLREKYCGPQVFQFSMDLKLKKMQAIEKNMKLYKDLFANLEVKCL